MCRQWPCWYWHACVHAGHLDTFDGLHAKRFHYGVLWTDLPDMNYYRHPCLLARCWLLCSNNHIHVAVRGNARLYVGTSICLMCTQRPSASCHSIYPHCVQGPDTVTAEPGSCEVIVWREGKERVNVWGGLIIVVSAGRVYVVQGAVQRILPVGSRCMLHVYIHTACNCNDK